MPARKTPAAVVLNAGSGTLSDNPDLVGRISEELGFGQAIDPVDPDAIEERLSELANDPPDGPIIVGGGDGTLSLAARTFDSTEATLILLPLGTMNLFARALCLPDDPVEALKAALRGTVTNIDLAVIGDTVFLHHVSIGLHPETLTARKERDYDSRLGKLTAGVQAVLEKTFSPPKLSVSLTIDDETLTRQVSSLGITNNPLAEGSLAAPHAVASGLLGVYVSESSSPVELMRLVTDVFRGRYANSEQIETHRAERLKVAFDADRTVRASIDGELEDVPHQFEVKKKPGALRVMLPGEGD
ncbi:MAG: diacylglycerol kinase family protein [Pseudomonadota bacterium]